MSLHRRDLFLGIHRKTRVPFWSRMQIRRRLWVAQVHSDRVREDCAYVLFFTEWNVERDLNHNHVVNT